MSKKLIVFIDSGDTLVNEGTEYRNEGSPIVQSCELIDGAKELLLTLKERYQNRIRGYCPYNLPNHTYKTASAFSKFHNQRIRWNNL